MRSIRTGAMVKVLILLDRKDSTLNYEIEHSLRFSFRSLIIYFHVRHRNKYRDVRTTYLQTGAVRDL